MKTSSFSNGSNRTMPVEWMWLMFAFARADDRVQSPDPQPDAAFLEFLADWETDKGQPIDPLEFEKPGERPVTPPNTKQEPKP